MSVLTKKAIVASFIKLLREKPFDKISVSDITAETGVARMTFYYHFKDVYDMVDYVIQEKLSAAVSKNFTYETWREDYIAVFESVAKEKSFFLKMFNALDLRKIEVYLSGFARKYVKAVIDGHAEHRGVSLDEGRREMLSDIFGYAVVGTLLNWIKNGMKEDPTEIVCRFYNTVKGTLDVMIMNARADR
jgi:probable dihydroxyacetone kinase regulator